jgi:hypothetical protein
LGLLRAIRHYFDRYGTILVGRRWKSRHCALAGNATVTQQVENPPSILLMAPRFTAFSLVSAILAATAGNLEVGEARRDPIKRNKLAGA